MWSNSLRFSFLSPRQWKRKRKRKRINVRENIDLPKEVQEKKTVLSIRVINLVFKSHVNFAIGKIVRPTGLLRNSNEETIGIDGNGAEESWRPVNSMFSHLHCLRLAQWSGLLPRSSPSVCSGLGQPHCLPWKPSSCESRMGQMQRMGKVHSVKHGTWPWCSDQQNLSSADIHTGKIFKSLHL